MCRQTRRIQPHSLLPNPARLQNSLRHWPALPRRAGPARPPPYPACRRSRVPLPRCPPRCAPRLPARSAGPPAAPMTQRQTGRPSSLHPWRPAEAVKGRGVAGVTHLSNGIAAVCGTVAVVRSTPNLSHAISCQHSSNTVRPCRRPCPPLGRLPCTARTFNGWSKPPQQHYAAHRATSCSRRWLCGGPARVRPREHITACGAVAFACR